MRLAVHNRGGHSLRAVRGQRARPRLPSLVVRRSGREDVAALNSGKDFNEELSGEANTMVTDVMGIDRTPELLMWLFSGGKEDGAEASAEQLAPASATAAGAAAAAPLAMAPALAFAGSGAAAPSSSPAPAPSSSSSSGAASPPAAAAASGSEPGPSGRRTELATVGGGCFWCFEACYLELQGVVSVTSGYAGGTTVNPTYKQVLTKKTGHAEVVQIEYDPSVLSYRDILQIFMSLHDPTTPNRSGNDVGPQYRSIILTHGPEQEAVAKQVVAEANKDLWFFQRVVTEVKPLQVFYPAEAYHQRYFARNPSQPYCAMVVAPKLLEFRRKYGKLRKDAQAEALL
ncbi:hypothetical protein HYH03_016695 [Edaphochlamys debaryana]|uniref:peptide-methionine (S)-S-oxide reductase n=1 Tax=Edaphochlamys debaryana TaxID=47281 RepID=A0A835XQV8_9CHLO|nr:hypothetical protein HYH03_016695 [Edaphochlamys debaryana]|eukprot:KAG2484459.1 hypothetical protein HYH03_016695 [Edaphochlamys debaryana]